MTTFQMVTLTARAAFAAPMSASDIAAMLAHGVLAIRASRAGSPLYRAHVGGMRATFRRAAGRRASARRAVLASM